MTKDERQILLQDLCARMPYEVICDASEWTDERPRLLIECIPQYRQQEIMLTHLAGRVSVEYVRPYLRPMSSMTEEERKEYNEVVKGMDLFGLKGNEVCIYALPVVWLNKRHFDYRGLIPMGLALPAKEGMYK